jgi:hypothetical protein
MDAGNGQVQRLAVGTGILLIGGKLVPLISFFGETLWVCRIRKDTNYITNAEIEPV